MKHKSNSSESSKIGFFLGVGGAGIGLIVGLWAPFILILPNIVNFGVLSFVTLVVGGILLGLTYFMLFKMKGFLKAISFLVFFSFLQFMNGIMGALSSFDEYGIIQNILHYFDYNIFILMPIFFAAGFIPMFFGMFYSQYINIFIREKVLNDGYRVDAKIVRLVDTPVRINNRRIYEIELDLNVPSFGNYRKEISTSISLLEVDKYKVGATVQVVVSKTNKNHIFIL